jgi:hypothetical protein
VDRALDECETRIRRAEEAADRIPSNPLTTVLHDLDRYLMNRVRSARL